MAEPEFVCVCHDPNKPGALITCVVCVQQVHAECYKHPTDKAFYCEQCILLMHDPLIGNTENLCTDPLVDNTDKRMGLRNIELKISEKHARELESGETYLNFYVIQMGHLVPTFENLQIMLDRASLTINTDRYNLIPRNKLEFSYNHHKRSYSLRIKVFLNEPDINGKLNISLAHKLDPSHLFNFVSQQKASELQDFPLYYSWRALVTKSSLSDETSVTSLIDPLTLLPISRPGKGLFCSHPGYFCLESYIKLNLQVKQREKQWCCPICHKRVYYQELFWDDDLQKHLDAYKKQNPAAMEDSSSEASDSGTQPLRKKSTEEAVLPKFKLYLHKGKVWTPAEMVRIAPWVLKQGMHHVQPLSETKPPSGAKLSVKGLNLSLSVRPDLQSAEVSSLKYPLNKRQPLEADEGKPPSGEIVDRTELLESKSTAKKNLGGIQKPLKKEAAKTSVRPERQQSSSSHRISLAGKLSPKVLHLKDQGPPTEAEPPGQVAQAVSRPAVAKDDSSFEFLNESSDEVGVGGAPKATGVVERPGGTMPRISPLKAGDGGGQAGVGELPEWKKVLEGQRAKEESWEWSPGVERREDKEWRKKSVKRSGAKETGESGKRGKESSGKTGEKSADLGNRKAPRAAVSQDKPLGKRSVSLAVFKNHTPGPAAKLLAPESDRRLGPLSGGKNRHDKSPPPYRCEPTPWTSGPSFVACVQNWKKGLAPHALKSLHSNFQLQSELALCAQEIFKSCVQLGPQLFHDSVLMFALYLGCEGGYTTVGCILGGVSTLLRPDCPVQVCSAYLKIFTLKRFGVSGENLASLSKATLLKNPPLIVQAQDLDQNWISIEDMVHLISGMARGLCPEPEGDIKFSNIESYLQIAAELIIAFVMSYCHHSKVSKWTPSSQAKPFSTFDQGCPEQVASKIIDKFSRHFVSTISKHSALQESLQKVELSSKVVEHLWKSIWELLPQKSPPDN